MSVTSTIYAASVNPTRRTKILPKPPQATDEEDEYVDAPSSPELAPVKRGRKPGTMSRTAREAQRKLNHSIIEKARRTKINDALATLRQLVPDHFGAQEAQERQDEADEDEDGEYGANGKKKGKKAEKEKEFKLEILVRTVDYMQHLIKRVEDLETGSVAAKRKSPADEDSDTPPGPSKKQRSTPSPTQDDRLPSISSWLHNNIDPSLRSPRQLPSPPSSTTFTPISQFYQPPPNLVLGSADEDAASLLLHMSGRSPMFRPTSQSPMVRPRTNSGGCPPLDLGVAEVSSKPLTPSAMLGMTR